MFPATGKGSSTSSTHWPQPCHHFEFPDILLATDNFNESLVIGRGGFGKVYKGTILIEPSPVVAAIKRLDSTSNQGATEFWAEVEMLSKLRHCHLVSLLGYCNDGKEMILVYEYMPHGTLEDHLHKHNTPLSWLQRLQICIGAARGLDYLHTGTGIELGVIHRDVKSSNILLHESWAAKISDFGLSRIGPKNQPTTYVNTLVKGTFGYLDPDYFRTGRLTRKSDVYAFGIVLFEVLCRKRAVDGSLHEEEWGLARWAQDSIKEGGLKQIIDYDMRNQISPKCLKEFARIANRCLHDHPKERPTMAEVVFTLESVLALQEKANISLQAGKTIFSRMVDMLPFPSKGEHSGDVVDSKPSSLQVFKFADLKRATSDFSLHMLLRDDGLRKVFLGWVDKETLAPSSPDAGMSVAIKRCYNENSQGHAEWLAEVNFLLLGQLAHPNIISLLGYCDNEEEKLLVYENMHNRSFDFFLYPDASVVGESLSWGTRLNIMMGVARGLAYLHSSQVQLIHRDVKSSNIFLDQDFNAKLGHFGMAAYSNVIGGATHVGSLGHVDPEYFMTGDLSVKSDVFSFGVVLLETLTGQRPLSTERPEEHRNLAMWVCLLAKEGESEQIMDPRLEQNYPKEGALKCIELAVRCLHLSRNERPSSEEVLRSLEAISALTSNGQ